MVTILKAKRKLRMIAPKALGITIPSTFTNLCKWLTPDTSANIELFFDEESDEMKVIISEIKVENGESQQ